jgi:hypothetical protein
LTFDLCFQRIYERKARKKLRAEFLGEGAMPADPERPKVLEKSRIVVSEYEKNRLVQISIWRFFFEKYCHTTYLHRGRFLNRFQVENLQVANLNGINLFTSSLELAKFRF